MPFFGPLNQSFTAGTIIFLSFIYMSAPINFQQSSSRSPRFACYTNDAQEIEYRHSTLVSLSSHKYFDPPKNSERLPSVIIHSNSNSESSRGACPKLSSSHSIARANKYTSHKNPFASSLDELVQKHSDVGENEATYIEAEEFGGVASTELETYLRFVRMF